MELATARASCSLPLPLRATPRSRFRSQSVPKPSDTPPYDRLRRLIRLQSLTTLGVVYPDPEKKPRLDSDDCRLGKVSPWAPGAGQGLRAAQHILQFRVGPSLVGHMLSHYQELLALRTWFQQNWRMRVNLEAVPLYFSALTDEPAPMGRGGFKTGSAGKLSHLILSPDDAN